MIRKIGIAFGVIFLFISGFIGINAQEVASILYEIKGNTVTFSVNYSEDYTFQWKINEVILEDDANFIEYEFKGNESIDVEVSIKDGEDEIALGKLNDFSISNSLSIIVLYNKQKSEYSVVGKTWGEVKNIILKDFDFGYGLIFDNAKIDNIILKDNSVINNNDIIEITSKSSNDKLYKIALVFKPEIDAEYQVSRFNKNDDIQPKNGKYELYKGKYQVVITKGDYQGYIKTFTVSKDGNIVVNLPDLLEIRLVKADGNVVVKKALENTSQTVISTNEKFIGWEVEGLKLSEEILKNNPLSFKMPGNNVTFKEILKEDDIPPKITKIAFTYDKAVNENIIIPFELGSGLLKADFVKGVYLDENTAKYTVDKNNVIIDKEYLSGLSLKSYKLKVVFDNKDNSEAEGTVNIIDNRTFNITVIGGTASKTTAKEKELIYLKAEDKADKKFVNWQSGDVVIKDIYSKETAFEMIGKDVKIEAIYTDKTHTLKVNNISSIKKVNEKIDLTAKNVNFIRWNVSGINVDVYNKTISFLMPDNDVTIDEVVGYKLIVNINENNSTVTLYKDNKAFNINGLLEKGTYTLKVSKDGFKDYTTNVNLDKDITLNINLEKIVASTTPTPTPTVTPTVKWTCEDEGKVWDEGKQRCVSLTTPTPVPTKSPTVKVSASPTASPTPTPTSTVTPTPTMTLTPTITPKASYDITPESTKKNNGLGVWFVAAGAIGIIAIGAIVWLIIKFVKGSVEE